MNSIASTAGKSRSIRAVDPKDSSDVLHHARSAQIISSFHQPPPLSILAAILLFLFFILFVLFLPRREPPLSLLPLHRRQNGRRREAAGEEERKKKDQYNRCVIAQGTRDSVFLPSLQSTLCSFSRSLFPFATTRSARLQRVCTKGAKRESQREAQQNIPSFLCIHSHE